MPLRLVLSLNYTVLSVPQLLLFIRERSQYHPFINARFLQNWCCILLARNKRLGIGRKHTLDMLVFATHRVMRSVSLSLPKVARYTAFHRRH